MEEDTGTVFYTGGLRVDGLNKESNVILKAE